MARFDTISGAGVAIDAGKLVGVCQDLDGLTDLEQKTVVILRGMCDDVAMVAMRSNGSIAKATSTLNGWRYLAVMRGSTFTMEEVAATIQSIAIRDLRAQIDELRRGHRETTEELRIVQRETTGMQLVQRETTEELRIVQHDASDAMAAMNERITSMEESHRRTDELTRQKIESLEQTIVTLTEMVRSLMSAQPAAPGPAQLAITADQPTPRRPPAKRAAPDTADPAPAAKSPRPEPALVAQPKALVAGITQVIGGRVEINLSETGWRMSCKDLQALFAGHEDPELANELTRTKHFKTVLHLPRWRNKLTKGWACVRPKVT
jgi:cobalamin biosynthesis Mg chelatase CobN